MISSSMYELLEAKMLGYEDYSTVPVIESEEPLVLIETSELITSYQIDDQMLAITGTTLYARAGVAERLQIASEILADRVKGCQLQVVYGYRALSIQRQLFEEAKSTMRAETEEDLLAATHRLIAVPEVAGHPAGAAVDIQVINEGEVLDFGTKIWEFTTDSYTFSPAISREAWQNRQLLRESMLQAGFAPFDGEWWHFSYGDKEWARYYYRPNAIYGQVEFKSPSVT